MPTAPQYPTPRFDHNDPTMSGEPDGPIITRFRTLEPRWPATVTKRMKDGGGNVSISNTDPELRWELVYVKVSQASSNILAMLDQHFAACYGFVLDFEFRHPKTGVIYQGVRYETFDPPDHGKRVWQQSRKVTLVQWPA
jgi:hypothetical protein